MRKKNLLQRGFLAHLPAEAATALLQAGTPSQYTSGYALLREGDRSRHVLLLTSGRVKVVTTAHSGYEALLNIRGPGDIVGELAYLDYAPRSASVIALEPLHARFLSEAAFEGFLRTYPAAQPALAGMVAGRLRAASRRRLEYAAYPAHRRLAVLLLELDEWYGRDRATGREIELALSQADLAGLIGASTESVAKVLRAWVHQHIIATRRRSVTLLDRSELEEIAHARHNKLR